MKGFDQPQKDTKALEKILDEIPKDTSGQYFERQTGQERQSLKDDNTPDLIEETFKEINPLGLSISDLEKNLEREIGELKSEIEELSANPELNKKLISSKQQEVLAKIIWIEKIDDFLLGKNIEDNIKFNPNLN